MYRIMILSSFILGTTLSAYLLKRRKVPNRIILMSLILELVLCVYLSLMTSYILSKATGYGLNSTGGALGMLIGAFIFSKITPQYKNSFFEAFTLSLPLMYGIGKIGCSFAGCCGGISYHGILSITSENGNVFPVQIVEAVSFIVLFLVLITIYLKDKYEPVKAAIICSLLKILLDFLRDTHADKIISTNQIMCMAVIVLLLVMKSREGHVMINTRRLND